MQHDPPSEVVVHRPVADGRGVVGADGWGWGVIWIACFFLALATWFGLDWIEARFGIGIPVAMAGIATCIAYLVTR